MSPMKLLSINIFFDGVPETYNWLVRTQRIMIFVIEWYAGGIETPFGGTGLSGYGREKGQEALYSYVQTKNVGINIS